MFMKNFKRILTAIFTVSVISFSSQVLATDLTGDTTGGKGAVQTQGKSTLTPEAQQAKKRSLDRARKALLTGDLSE